jgi:hypothetical protein
MHEHVLCVDHSMRIQYPDIFHRPTELQNAIAKLSDARRAGVRTMIDVTPIDLGRDPASSETPPRAPAVASDAASRTKIETAKSVHKPATTSRL